MRAILTTLFLLVGSICMNGQGSGFGYLMDVGGSAFSQSTFEYDQMIRSVTHNGFIRFHNESGHLATQLMLGYRTDKAFFQNFSDFLGADDVTMEEYNSDALIERYAWKFGLIEQLQFGRHPGRFIFSLNPGLFYEYTVQAFREGNYDGISYQLYDEINPHNLGYTLGFELRFRWITFGYKAEQLFRDVLDHDYILSQELNVNNSTELRGLKLNPLMHYFYFGINIDFFDK